MGSIYDTYDDENFLKKLAEFEPLIWYAAKRYEVRGRLPAEDLYQEGLLALDDTLEQHWQHDPESHEFNRAFKSRLWHRMSHCLRHHNTESRDWKKEVRSFVNEEGDEISPLENVPQTTFPDPDITLRVRDVLRYLHAIKEDLIDQALKASIWGNSADDALQILQIIMASDDEIPDSMRDMYERIPSRLTKTVLVELTGWDIMKVRRGLNRLRTTAKKLAPSYGILPF